jgi:tetratricopeptide (TPR) repeat protein
LSSPPLRLFSLLLVLLVSLAGCVTLKPATRVPTADAVVLAGVPLTRFGAQNCGAASLSAVMRYWRSPISIEALDPMLPKADNGGVLSLDMALAARRNGFHAELVVGDRNLIRASIQAGRPLILMIQLVDVVGESHDLFHYVIVDGFDPEKDLVRVQYGDGKARWVSLDRLSDSWDNTGFATLVITPAGETEDTSDPILYAVALEEVGLFAEAEAIYRHQLAASPGSPLLWVNLGNVLNARGLGPQAEEAYREALDLNPMHSEALNNLAWLLLESGGDLTEAQELVSRAVALGGPDPYLALDTMGRILLEMERCTEAMEVFELALETAPMESSARGWVFYGLAQAQRDCGDPATAIETLESALQEGSDQELSTAIEVELGALRPQ